VVVLRTREGGTGVAGEDGGWVGEAVKVKIGVEVERAIEDEVGNALRGLLGR